MQKPDRPCVHYTELKNFHPRHPSPEYETFLRELPRLLAEGHEGKFALIKGGEILGLYDSDKAASRIRTEQHYGQSCIIQQINEWEPVYRQPWC